MLGSIKRMNAHLQGPTDKATIDVRTLRLTIALIAICLPFIADQLTPLKLTSISASYFAGDWPRNYFVGSLFIISFFLFAYKGEVNKEAVVSKVAAFAALGIALFPCDCTDVINTQVTTMLQCIGVDPARHPEAGRCLLHSQEVDGAHYFAAAVMYGAMAYFCYIFWKRAQGKVDERMIAAGHRVFVYKLAFAGILLSITGLILDYLLHHRISASFSTFVFWMEATGLVSFGVSWLLASKVLPYFSHKSLELYNPFSRDNPKEPGVRGTYTVDRPDS